MAASAYSNNFGSVWHKIVGAVWKDAMTKEEPTYPQYLEEIETQDKYFDDVEMVSPGLWSQTGEGEQLHLDTYGEGGRTRYEPRKFSQQLIIPEELEEDSKYEEAFAAGAMQAFTCRQTQEYEAVRVLNDAFTTANGQAMYDGLSLCSTVHKISGGGTVSNQYATAMSPSNTAMTVGLIMIDKLPGTNGLITGEYKAKTIVGPSNYKFRFREILKSDQRDDTANNAVNSIKGEVDKYVSVPFMSSTSNWFFRTNAKRGAMWVWRRRPRLRMFNDIQNETKIFTGSARWTTGASNWRTFIGSNI